MEIIVVDNASTDSSCGTVKNRFPSVILIENKENFGFAKANNIGIGKAMEDDSEYIITINNDVELEVDCLENLKIQISDLKNKYDIFQILMLNYYDRNIIDAAGIEFDKYFFAYQAGYKANVKDLDNFKNEISGVCAGAGVYSKRALSEIKDENGDYFDSSFFAYYEDVDLALRLLNKGYKSYLVKNSIVYHVHSGTGTEGSPFKTYYLTRNLFLYLRKNLGTDKYRKSSPVYAYVLFKNLFKYVTTGKFDLFKAAIKGYFDYRKIISVSRGE